MLSSLLFGFFTTTVYASDGGRVEAMQMPAWYVRDGAKQALRPDTRLRSGDKVSTGQASRLLIRLEEGSLVKLGENGALTLETLQPPAQSEGIFSGLLNVVRGAFRFTTSKIGQQRKRNIDITIGAVTAGIRGTDIWGRSSDEKDILCLIEGKITAQRTGEAAFPMQQALSFYVAPKNQPALPVAPVPEAKLARWAMETEIQSGQGVLTANGQWAVNLMSLQNAKAASKLQQQLNHSGYAAEQEEVRINDITWYRIRINHFAGEKDARSFAMAMSNQYGIQNPWIVKAGSQSK